MMLLRSVFALILTGATATAAPPLVTCDATAATVSNGLVTVRVDLATDGRVSIEWVNGVRLVGATAAVRLTDDPRERSVAAYRTHTCDAVDVTAIDDGFGSGVHLVIHHTAANEPELRQHFWLYAGRPDVYTQLDVVGGEAQTIATCEIAPLLIERNIADCGVLLGVSGKPQSLFVPFDNDAYARYASNAWTADAQSYEVGALYDDDSRRGIVIGSVTHDRWKTGVQLRSIDDAGRAGALRVFGGAADRATHDVQDHSGRSHGIVRGSVVSSPRIFVGAFDDWRDGLEAFGRANAIIRPALAWDGGVPFGWNSWAAHKAALRETDIRAAIDLIDALRGRGFTTDDTAYVNLDSYWDNLDDAALTTLARAAHGRGLRFGLYYAPFCYWGDDLNAVVPGTDGAYRYGDIVLRAATEPLPKLDQAWPLDPTHPGTRMRNDALFARFAKIGVDFVKLDFLTHGALEGAHHDPAITTGIAGYNAGMRDVVEALSPQRMGRRVFISLSIAPLFPHGYGHSRRISCDAFGSIDASEYLMNSQTFGWWTAGTLYAFNDPDHTVVYQTQGERVSSDSEGRTRLNASIVVGGMLLASDDATNAKAREQMLSLLINAPTLKLARQARTFRPIAGDSGTAAGEAFVRMPTATDGATYVAVFNYGKTDAATRDLPLARIGVAESSAPPVAIDTDQRTGEIVNGAWRVNLPPASSIVARFVGTE